jgi:hypothetical protein
VLNFFLSRSPQQAGFAPFRPGTPPGSRRAAPPEGCGSGGGGGGSGGL